jgi:hypothetical protein
MPRHSQSISVLPRAHLSGERRNHPLIGHNCVRCFSVQSGMRRSPSPAKLSPHHTTVHLLAPVAQWIEHLTTDQKVGGSSPSGRANVLSQDIVQICFEKFSSSGQTVSPTRTCLPPKFEPNMCVGLPETGRAFGCPDASRQLLFSLSAQLI